MTGKRMRVGWRGYIPAITTPFDVDGQLDLSGLGTLLEWLHAEGMHGLVVAGTTGEWTSLAPQERKALITAVGEQMKGKISLIAGCTAFTAQEVLDFAETAHACGYEGVLVTPPPYIRPSADEIVSFYQTVSDGSALPICVYNWPPGTGVDMNFDLLRRLAEIENVVAIKQSTGDLRRFVQTYFGLCEQIRVFGHSMDDGGLALLRGGGGDGTMGAGGVLGRTQPDFYNHVWAGDFEAARACGRQDRVIMDAWYTSELVGRFGSGPAILKAALNIQGLPGGYVRRPLLDVREADLERIRETLASLGRA